jgi:opacity protein-like surface antigen
MKKISKIALLFSYAIVSSTIIATSNIALSDSIEQEKKKFYFSAGVGMLKPSKTPKDQIKGVDNNIFQSPDTELSYPKKNIIAPFAAFGYYLKNNLRLEVAFIRPFVKDTTSNQNIIFTIKRLARSVPIPYEIKHSANINLGQLRVYFDALPIKEYGSLYVAGGLGYGQIQSTSSIQSARGAPSYNKESVTKYCPNWMLGIGANLNMAEGIKFGIGYEFQNFGKSKTQNLSPETTQPARTFKGSSATLRLIYDI